MNTEKLTGEQLYELGFEIVSGMHASAHNQDIEMGRLETKAGTELPTSEELSTEGLTEIPDYCYRAVEWEKKRLNDQISFIVGVVIDKLGSMGLSILHTAQVEQQTKQLKEGRDDFHDLLIQLVECLDNGYAIKKGSPIHQEATRLLNQLNQKNEG